MLLENLKKHHIILASQSPRRKELLKNLGINFEVRVKDGIEETFPEHLQGSIIATYLAEQKANVYKNELKENELLIAADTIVYLDNEVLGKPQNRLEAQQMLAKLSGRKHEVITGVCLMQKEKFDSFCATSIVYFKELEDCEIDYYIDTYKPFDKAGSYGIQEWIGYIGIEKIEGSYFNVMGLPVQKLYEKLAEFVK